MIDNWIVKFNKIREAVSHHNYSLYGALHSYVIAVNYLLLLLSVNPDMSLTVFVQERITKEL